MRKVLDKDGGIYMKLKRLISNIILGATIVTLSLGVAGCSKENTSESTLNKETLIVGMDDAFAPMGFKDENGEITGFDVELAKAICEKLNKKVVFQPIDWTMKETELKSGNIDLIWNGYTINEERKKKVDFSVPYLKNKQVIVTLSNSDIKAKKDLEGKKVGAQNESSAISAIEKEEDLYNSFNGGSAMAAATSEGESSNDNKIPDTLKPLFGSLHNNEANS